ncbi:MAG: hypothetical protein ACI4F5_06390 [Acutalibacteraceae bacterium]
MAEYIDKDKLLNDIECIDISDCTDIDDIFTEVERTIDEQPTADVVEVVRCKEHKNARKTIYGYIYCRVDNCIAHKETDYCSYGKRKESEETDNDKL